MKPDAHKKLKSVATMFLVVGLAASGVGCGYLFLTPKVWQTTAKVRVEARGWVRAEKTDPRATPSNEAPYMDAERQLMRSDEVLGNVIENLRLRETWSKRTQASAPMNTNDALRRLRAMAGVQIIPHTSVLEVRVTSDDRSEIVPIANEIVRLYCDHRQSQRKAASQEKIVALQKQWEEESGKLSQAQKQLEKIVLDINQARAAAAGSLYDPEAFEKMQNDREQREAALVADQGQFDHLKTLNPDQLRLVLPTLLTNDVLNTTLERSEEARRAAKAAQTKPGADADEIKRAIALAVEADQRVDQAMAGVFTEREADLAARKTLLEKLDQQLRTARTNVGELSPDNPAYLAAQQRVQLIEEDREQLRNRLLGNDSLEALSPFSLSAQIVDSADTPMRPISPDGRLGFGVIAGGVAVCLCGLLLFLAGKQVKPTPNRPARQIRMTSYDKKWNESQG